MVTCCPCDLRQVPEAGRMAVSFLIYLILMSLLSVVLCCVAETEEMLPSAAPEGRFK